LKVGVKQQSFDVEQYIQLVKSFHGYLAPGVVLGGFMVNQAKSNIPEGTLFKAICETSTCLPDAIQLLTPCTIGNNRLKIINLGRYALSLYDRENGEGFRVFLLPQKIEENSEIRTWLFKIKPKVEQNMDLLLAQIKEVGETLCGIQYVRVRPELLHKQKRGEIVICPCCQEAYPANDGQICFGCQGQSPYILTEASETHSLTMNDIKSHRRY
jgi:formylmethanofuran dehydrogenase subunit E